MDEELGRSWPHISAGNGDNDNHCLALSNASQLTDLVLGNEDPLLAFADFAHRGHFLPLSEPRFSIFSAAAAAAFFLSGFILTSWKVGN